MHTTHHPHHPHHTSHAAKQLNLDLRAPTHTITDRPTLRLDLTHQPSGLKILTATLKPHPNPRYQKHAHALLRHDHQHIAHAADHYGVHIIILTTHHGLPPHDPEAHLAPIRRRRPLQLHQFHPHTPQAKAA